MGSGKDEELPLRGLRVLEFSHTVMGPTAGLVLADLGCDVIKVEPPRMATTRAACRASPSASSATSTATSGASSSI
jgi:crotonobetainyl-CoA:carnitine CoA-transferase CaiB-like acyl-CoA transferase